MRTISVLVVLAAFAPALSAQQVHSNDDPIPPDPPDIVLDPPEDPTDPGSGGGPVPATTDLAVVSYSMPQNSVTLSFTIPVSESPATHVVIKYSTLPVTDATWDGDKAIAPNGHELATLPGFVFGEPFQLTQVLDEALAPETTYYFAAKSERWGGFYLVTSPLSNVASKLTPDGMLPSATTLTVSSPGSASLTLNWLQAGDDGLAGLPASFELRISETPPGGPFFTPDSWFLSALPVDASSVPLLGNGAPAALTVGGLAGGRTYYFALRTHDGSGNSSGLSNIAGGTTLGGAGEAGDSGGGGGCSSSAPLGPGATEDRSGSAGCSGAALPLLAVLLTLRNRRS